MEYYIMFVGEQYYPKAGLRDMLDEQFPNVTEAVEHFEETDLKNGNEWAQIVRVNEHELEVAAEWGQAFGGLIIDIDPDDNIYDWRYGWDGE